MAIDPNNDPLLGEALPRLKRPHAPLPGAAPISNGTPTAAVGPAGAEGAMGPNDSGLTYREEDPRTRAARRAAELREHGSLNDDGVDEFYIDPRIIPDGWSYEYKRYTVLGAQDPSYQVSLALKGWEAVPARRHPELMPDNYTGNTIERKGMILMERPAEITNESKARELRKAREQVGSKEAQLKGMPAGPNSPFEPNSKIARSYETIAVPK